MNAAAVLHAARAAVVQAWRGSSGHAVLHALTAVASGLTLIIEPPGGYTFPVYDGPEFVLAWTGQPLTAWGVLMLTLGVVVLVLRAQVASRWVLAHLVPVWATFGGSALWVGLTNDAAASLLGISWLALAAGCLRAVLSMGPERLSPPCPLREDCPRLPLLPAAPGGARPARR